MKKLIIRIILPSVFVFNSTFVLLGQEKVIEGMVTIFDSIPLIGASIKVKITFPSYMVLELDASAERKMFNRS